MDGWWQVCRYDGWLLSLHPQSRPFWLAPPPSQVLCSTAFAAIDRVIVHHHHTTQNHSTIPGALVQDIFVYCSSSEGFIIKDGTMADALTFALSNLRIVDHVKRIVDDAEASMASHHGRLSPDRQVETRPG